jgi:tetratricopeptide (TPR) repeat protein
MRSKKTISTLLLASCTASFLLMVDAAAAQSVAAVNTSTGQAATSVMNDVQHLQSAWAKINYQTPGKDEQVSAFEALEKQGEQVIAKYPDRAEPKIWQGIILSTHAGAAGGFSALSLVKKAKALFEQAINIDSNALDGSAHTSLGSLYYQVPGWPLGFGSDKKAEQHLKQALSINPKGIDANYFYGDYLSRAGRYQDARAYLKTALDAPDRPNRPLADAGRRQEIRAALAKIDSQVKN